MDRRKIKKIKPPFCSSSHVWGDFIPVRTSDLEKRCKHCPAILTREEYLKLKITPIVKVWHREKVVNTDHIHLFNY